MLLRLPTTPSRCAALFLLTALSAGCHNAVPSIFLQMEDPTGIAPTQLRVTVRVEGLDTTSVIRPEVPGAPLVGAQTMRLLLPDAAVGHTAQLDIEALKEGAVVGTALVSAAVVLGVETRVSVALNPAGCVGDSCSCDASNCPNGCCAGNVCTMPSAAGACGTGGVACSPCPVESTDRCTEGACRCGAELPCGSGYRCEAGTCVSTGGPACTGPSGCVTPPGQCFETQGICGVDGVCTYARKGAGAGCNDGDSCTDLDACDGLGACVGTPRVCNTPGGVCRESSGTCLGGSCLYALVAPGTGCNDGNACTTGDSCNDSGACGGTQLSCNSPPGQCHQAAGSCSDGSCNYPYKNSGATCDDGNACTTGDTCNGTGGCAGTAMVCNSPPTQCHQATGTCSAGTCTYALKSPGSLCNDGNACTTSDTCNAAGACGGTAMVCNSPPTQCHQTAGSCSGGTCGYALKTPGSVCNDGNACTTSDTCNAAGACGGSAVTCDSPPGQCYQAAGTCSGGTCGYAPKNSGATCNDNNACTTSDVCNGSGGCGGTAIVCNSPPSQCHQAVGSCSGGTCTYALKSVGSVCDDGNECTDSDGCNASGACVGTLAPVGTSCGFDCQRCNSSGVCGGGCGFNQQCCPGNYCLINSQECGIEP